MCNVSLISLPSLLYRRNSSGFRFLLYRPHLLLLIVAAESLPPFLPSLAIIFTITAYCEWPNYY